MPFMDRDGVPHFLNVKNAGDIRYCIAKFSISHVVQGFSPHCYTQITCARFRAGGAEATIAQGERRGAACNPGNTGQMINKPRQGRPTFFGFLAITAHLPHLPPLPGLDGGAIHYPGLRSAPRSSPRATAPAAPAGAKNTTTCL